MGLEIKVLAGAESKAWLVDFTKQIDRLEKLTGGKKLASTGAGATVAPPDTEEEEEQSAASDDADDDFGAKKKPAAKKTASFDDDADDAPPAPKAKKAKKLTVDDVNDACKKRALAGGKKGREQVLAILKREFSTQSVGDLEPEQFQDVIDAMAVEE